MAMCKLSQDIYYYNYLYYLFAFKHSNLLRLIWYGDSFWPWKRQDPGNHSLRAEMGDESSYGKSIIYADEVAGHKLVKYDWKLYEYILSL